MITYSLMSFMQEIQTNDSRQVYFGYWVKVTKNWHVLYQYNYKITGLNLHCIHA